MDGSMMEENNLNGAKHHDNTFDCEALPTITIMSTADFDNPIWTNKQHLAVGLAEKFSVYYINSIGLRSPRLNRNDIARILRRLFSKNSSQKVRSNAIASENTNLKILSPRVLPFHGNPIARKINSVLLKRFIKKHIKPEDRNIFWTFTPVTYDIDSLYPTTIYHSVDLLHTFPHTPSKYILEKETEISTRAYQLIASSAGVRDHLFRQTGKIAKLWENVAEIDLYSSSRTETPKNRAIFSGNLTPIKINFELLFEIAKRGIDLAIAGPIAIDGTHANVEIQRLLREPNVEYLGVLSPNELATEVGNSVVGLVPYNLNDHTTGIFPMKIFEYLGAGLEVICTELPSLKKTQLPAGINVVSESIFVDSVQATLVNFDASEALDRSERARPYSWENRIKEATKLIQEIDPR
jgi:teichuronic acid biosynthesis glycosyltransferase TuaH